MDQGVALFPENELVTMKMEFCGSAAMVDFFFGGGKAPRKEISEGFLIGILWLFFLFFFFLFLAGKEMMGYKQ